ncbi:MAG: SIMPL domain-containing protein [Acidimicrobiia bacterium]
MTAWPAAAGAATEDGGREPRTITVTGTGLVRGTPDVLELVVGVKTRAPSAAEALTRNSTLTRKVIEVLQDAGVDSDDLQTTDLSITPFYDDEGDDLDGYSVNNLLSATIRDLEKAGGIIDAATEAAGNEILVQGIFFSFDDNTELVARARTDAVKRARIQAEQLADAAGVDLGDLLSLTEDSIPYGPALEFDQARAASGELEAAAPIEPGSQSLSVQVTLIYEIT